MEILIGVLVGIDVVFIGLFYVMWRRMKTMKNRIKMTDIRLGEVISNSERKAVAMGNLWAKIDCLAEEIGELKGEIYES